MPFWASYLLASLTGNIPGFIGWDYSSLQGLGLLITVCYLVVVKCVVVLIDAGIGHVLVKRHIGRILMVK